MNPKQRFIYSRIKIGIEFPVIFIGQICRLPSPCRLHIINDPILVCIDIFPVFPFLFFSKHNGNRQETTIFFQQGLDTLFFKKFLIVIIDI